MNQRSLIASAVAVLALAACQQPGNGSEIAIDNQLDATVAVDNAILKANEDGGTANLAPGAPDKALASEIPAQFHGRWGLNVADCTSTRGDAKGLLTISSGRLTFYESRGTIDTVLAASPTSFDARYDFTGEGQAWQRTERLALVGGKLQRRTDAEAGQEPPINLSYERCT